jgi:hypothetical protein
MADESLRLSGWLRRVCEPCIWRKIHFARIAQAKRIGLAFCAEMTRCIFQGFDQASQPIAKVRSMVRQATCRTNIGRCSSCDLEYRQIQQRTRLIALFVGIGSWSRLNETNHQLALLRENLNNWSLLPADVSSWATIKRRSERVGSTKQNYSDHTYL